MKSKLFIKCTCIILIFTLIFANFNITSIATEEQEPSYIEFEVRPNIEKGSKPLKASNGLDCYKQGDIIAVDLYLTTMNSNLNYCAVDVASSNNRYHLQIQDKIEINPELNNLKDYVTVVRSGNIELNSGRFTFDATKAEGIYLNNAKELKLATFYFKTTSNIIGVNNNDKLEISCNATAKRNIELKSVSTNYAIYISDIPTSLEATATKTIIKVGEETEINSTVYTELNGDNLEEYTLQDVNYTSSNDEILKVFPDKTIRGMKKGTATITVSSLIEPNIKKTIEIQVLTGGTTSQIDKIEIDNKISTLQLGTTYTLKISFRVLARHDVKLVSSNTNVATIVEDKLEEIEGVINTNHTGTITAVGTGHTTITVYSEENLIDTMELEVINNVQKVEILNPVSYVISEQKQPYQLSVKVTMDDGSIQYQSLTKFKSSNPEIIEIDDTGKIMPGRKPGIVKITAYVGEREDHFYAKVISSYGFVELKGVKIANKKTNMKLGEIYDLEVKTVPEDATNQDRTFSSSNTSVATVDKNGRVTALKTGTTIIRTTAGEFTDYYELRVVEDEIPITTFELSKNEIEMDLIPDENGKPQKLTETIQVIIGPEYSTQNQTFICTSSNRDVAEVSQEGKNITITSNAVGTATITVTSTENENLKATCEVKIYGFSFKNIGQPINQGDTVQSEYVSHLKNPEEEYQISYSSSNPTRATVNQTGEITMLDGDISNGWVVITLTAVNPESRKAYTATMAVKGYVACTGLEITPKLLEIEVGKEGAVEAIKHPKYANNAIPSYKSSNPDVATVNWQNGKIVALKEGRTIITVEVDEYDKHFSDTCEVVVVTKMHSDKTIYEATESTCKTHGHERYEMCNVCGEILRGSNTELPLSDHKGGIATCIKRKVCEVCGQEYGVVDASNHKNTEIRNKVQESTKNEGYTGDLYCKDCNTLLKKGESIAKIPEEEPKVWLGDVDKDGEITTKDAKMVLQHIVEKITLTDEQFARADTSKDNQITTEDAKLILQHIVQKIVLPYK